MIVVGFDPHADKDRKYFIQSRDCWYLTHGPVSLTANLYWSMLGSGLGLMAVCLLTFRGLLDQFSLDAIAQSFRSTFSLHSRASQAGSVSKNSKTEPAGVSSEPSEQERSTFETHAIREGKVENGSGRVPDGKILVQSSIGRVEDWA